MFNYIIIPSLVDFFSYYEGYERKSDRHRKNLFKQFIILVFASVFIPISGQAAFADYLQELPEGNFE
jgi:hypothetical protein